jgi:hypothetical protein
MPLSFWAVLVAMDGVVCTGSVTSASAAVVGVRRTLLCFSVSLALTFV